MGSHSKGRFFVLKVVAISFAVPLVLWGYALLPIWNCGACNNKPIVGFGRCPYCSGTGKQNLIDRLRYAIGIRGGGWLQAS